MVGRMGKEDHLLIFFLNSPSGSVFLKSIDTSDVIKDDQKIFELLDNIVEEIGEENVVQVVTNNASNLVATGRIELSVFYNTISNAKKITTYKYRHTWVLNLYRQYSKGGELARPTCVIPLVEVLRLVDSDSKPVMPYIYEAMDRAKEQIAKNFQKQESRYKKVWKIIDTRWNLQLHRPLHAAAYYLNP
ncbi:hypothetical protein CR513_31527, partial [Mucuna pruriens]